MADPDFGRPGRIDVLLGVEAFVKVLLQGRWIGAPNSPVTFETEFSWVIAGRTDLCIPTNHVATHHAVPSSGDDIIRKFWEIEEPPMSDPALSPEERTVIQHFKDNHFHTPEGRFVVHLPKKPEAKSLGDSRCQAVQRFLSLECSLQSKGQLVLQ